MKRIKKVFPLALAVVVGIMAADYVKQGAVAGPGRDQREPEVEEGHGDPKEEWIGRS